MNLRSVLVLLVGIVLGLGLALSTTVWTALTAREVAPSVPALPDPAMESSALVAAVMDRVRREYVDRIDDKHIVESAI